jgi:ketosteroid isomerase-like protein
VSGLEAREEEVIAMIGALVMRKVMSKNQAATVNAKDIEGLKKFWADDVSLTFVGQPPIEGKDAVEAWYRSWFAGIKEIRETSTNFALVHPYAVGVSNTVLFEATSDIEFTDGRRVVESEATVIEIRGGKATSIRVYIADEDGGQVLMGSRASRNGAARCGGRLSGLGRVSPGVGGRAGRSPGKHRTALFPSRCPTVRTWA